MRRSTRIGLLKEEFPIGKKVVFHGQDCIVTSWSLMNVFGETCCFIVLTRSTGDFIAIDPYEWLDQKA